MSDYKTDPRYLQWRERVRIWRKTGAAIPTHRPDDPMPITPDECCELEDIFPAHQRFADKDNPAVVWFGDPHFSQRFVVINGNRSEALQD